MWENSPGNCRGDWYSPVPYLWLPGSAYHLKHAGWGGWVSGHEGFSVCAVKLEYWPCPLYLALRQVRELLLRTLCTEHLILSW